MKTIIAIGGVAVVVFLLVKTGIIAIEGSRTTEKAWVWDSNGFQRILDVPCCTITNSSCCPPGVYT